MNDLIDAILLPANIFPFLAHFPICLGRPSTSRSDATLFPATGTISLNRLFKEMLATERSALGTFFKETFPRFPYGRSGLILKYHPIRLTIPFEEGFNA